MIVMQTANGDFNMTNAAREKKMHAHEKSINEDLVIMPGCGATMKVGSDSYPRYVSEVLPNGVVGIYAPLAKFDESHPWECGVQVVEKYDASHPTDTYIKRRYGNWWECSKDGKTIVRKFTGKYSVLVFGHAYSYKNPSF